MRAARPLVLTALAALCLLLLAGPAAAHVGIESSTPEDGATVEEPPSEVVVELDGDLADEPVEARVLDPGGDDLVAGDVEVDGRTITIPLNLAVVEGEHTVDLAFTAADGHEQVETITFTFAPPAGVATPTEDLTGPPVEPSPDATPTPTPEATPTATPTATDEAPSPSPTATETDGVEVLTSDPGGGVGLLAVVVGAVAVAAVGALLVLRLRRPDADAFTDADQDG